MIFTRISPFTGIQRTIDIPCTQEQIDIWKSGTLLQHAFPNLSPDQREFIKSGITGEEWDIAFSHGNFSKCTAETDIGPLLPNPTDEK